MPKERKLPSERCSTRRCHSIRPDKVPLIPCVFRRITGRPAIEGSRRTCPKPTTRCLRQRSCGTAGQQCESRGDRYPTCLRRLFAAFCQLSDISAAMHRCQSGGRRCLKNLDGDGPEAAAKDLTTVVSGMAVILAVNRADKLEVDDVRARQGRPEFRAARAVHLHAALRRRPDARHRNPNQLKTQGFEVVDSARLDHDQAMQILANHTRRGRGGRGSRIE